MYAGKEATVRPGHGTKHWLQIGKGVQKGCISSPCLFNLHTEYVMQNAGLDEVQAEIKIDGRKINFHFNPKKGNANECSNYHTIALISHASKVMLKILQGRLQQYVNHEPPDVQAGFREGRRTRDQIANICLIVEKAREFQKTFTFALLTMPKPLTVWITRNCGKF